MSNPDPNAATPFGGPETSPEPNTENFYEIRRPRLGGLMKPIDFSEQQVAILNAIADTMVPGGDGFPAPSEVNVVNFIARYITPSGFKNKHYPFASEDEFKAAIDKLGANFASGDTKSRTEALAAMEKAEDPVFDQLRSLVYYGYYSMPEVTLAIRANVPAGKDYHGPPLPYGYLHCIEDWDPDLIDRAGGNGSYIATEDVKRVDLSKLSWTTK